jgi:DNA-directed RNA polymerase specialized sigma24 family protein
MKRVLQFHSDQHRLNEDDPYTTMDDFQRLFATEMSDLFRLSLSLTADAEKAESCLIFAMRECFGSANGISKRWARNWARRVVIRNAIRLVLGEQSAIPDEVPNETGSDIHLQPNEYRIAALRESPAILDMPDFDRLVFVICVLERYSILDCALLLKRSPKDVVEARRRAIDQVISEEQRNRGVPAVAFPTCSHSAGGNGIGELDGSCGSILD